MSKSDKATKPKKSKTPKQASTSRFGFLKGKDKRIALVIGLVAVVLLAGSAAAFYGVAVLNSPENILKTAVEKQLEKEQSSSKGKITVDLKDEEATIKNVTVDFKAATDTPKKAFSIEANVAAGGAELPVEVRGVDQSLYFKVGDLGSIKGVAALAGGEEATDIVNELGDKLSNQWIEANQSLLKQVNAECTTGLVAALSQEDINQIMKVYGESSFVTVKGTSDSQIDGKDATKYELGLDKEKAQAFASKLDGVQALKKISDCGKTTSGQAGDQEVAKDVEDTAKNADVTMAVWVDGDKNLRQIELKASDDAVDGTFTITFTDEAVNIQKPEDAKSFLEVVGDYSDFFGEGISGLGQTSDTSSSPLEGLSDDCKEAIQKYITSQGTAPMPTGCL